MKTKEFNSTTVILTVVSAILVAIPLNIIVRLLGNLIG